MQTQWERMIAGQPYDPLDPQLAAARAAARDLFRELNRTGEAEAERRAALIKRLFGGVGAEFWLEPPFTCDYGVNITVGDRVFFNFDCVILDPAPVTIGDRVMFGPGVHVYTPTHPLDHRARAEGVESAHPVQIGSDVWVSGRAVICPGVRIGDRTVIGAGSVVTRDIPSDVFAAGNPCRIIRRLNRPQD